MAAECWKLLITGRVQGVYYRASTCERAQALGVVGQVRNLPSGQVEVIAQGPAEDLQVLLDWCWQGPPAAQVTTIEVARPLALGPYTDFITVR